MTQKSMDKHLQKERTTNTVNASWIPCILSRTSANPWQPTLFSDAKGDGSGTGNTSCSTGYILCCNLKLYRVRVCRLCKHIVTAALELIRSAIKCSVVRIAIGTTHSRTVLLFTHPLTTSTCAVNYYLIVYITLSQLPVLRFKQKIYDTVFLEQLLHFFWYVS